MSEGTHAYGAAFGSATQPLSAAFDAVDTNRDGVIDRAEWAAVQPQEGMGESNPETAARGVEVAPREGSLATRPEGAGKKGPARGGENHTCGAAEASLSPGCSTEPDRAAAMDGRWGGIRAGVMRGDEPDRAAAMAAEILAEVKASTDLE